MPHASDVNASSSSSSEDSYADSAHKIEDSDDDGSQQPSPSQYQLQQAEQNADATEDDYCEDNESDYGSIPDMVSDSEVYEDYQRSELTPAAQSAAAVSQESLLEKFAELTRDFAT
jgi:hypothetical protein